MENSTSNPLSGFFRQPSIFLKLPSNGRYWQEGSLDLPVTGEIPVYPMTTKDEILLKTPDALLNGQGVVDVIQSCCPNIKNAWEMPSIDVDAALIAIRIATYGSNMPVTSKCAHCGAEHEHEIDMSGILSNLNTPSYTQMLEYKTLKIKLKPQKYFSVNKTSKVNFEEQRMMDALQMGEDIDPEIKAKQLTDSMQKLVDLSLENAADSTDYIEMQDGTRIDDHGFIKEFYEKTELSLVHAIQDRLAEIADTMKIKPMPATCDECNKEYPIEIAFDYSSFFG